jgi:hypothetical protein
MIDLHSSNDWVRSLRLAAGIALCAASVSAQTGLPNFSGTWEPISADPSATAAVQTVRQTDRDRAHRGPRFLNGRPRIRLQARRQ